MRMNLSLVSSVLLTVSDAPRRFGKVAILAIVLLVVVFAVLVLEEGVGTYLELVIEFAIPLILIALMVLGVIALVSWLLTGSVL